jgi:hypothetical protein
MDLNKWNAKISEYERQRVIYVVKQPRFGWHETWLTNWICANFRVLGFEDLCLEGSKKYDSLRLKLGVVEKRQYPDGFLKRGGKWLKLEIECVEEEYYSCHPPNYADVIVCYHGESKKGPPEVISLKTFLGVKMVIADWEKYAFLYLYDADFKREYTFKNPSERKFAEGLL